MSFTRILSHALILIISFVLVPQSSAQTTDILVNVTVKVESKSIPVHSAIVKAGDVGGITNEIGEFVLTLPLGTHLVHVSRLGYESDSVSIALQTIADTLIVFDLRIDTEEVEVFVVTSNRGERRVEDTPIRVEIIDDEELGEKVAMSPGDIGMMLNETGGLRVQSTNPSLGGANVRIQGLRGRYSLILADGLPLYGGQAGGLGLLQIPPIDLGRVEIIKGTASALHGSSALGGVIDLISKRPNNEMERTILLNQTSNGGTDGAFFLNGSISESLGATLLISANRQQGSDIDNDGWTDVPGYTRSVIRPRLFFDNKNGKTAFVTAGYTGEKREGGTLFGAVTPAGSSYIEFQNTDRADIGLLARWLLPADVSLFGMNSSSGSILTIRGSGTEQWHKHTWGSLQENDRHGTWFAELALAVPRGAATYILGGAFQRESYSAEILKSFDYAYNIPAVFTQVDADLSSSMSLSASVRADMHSRYGNMINPRISLLYRLPPKGIWESWTSRLSVGTGAFAPTPFVEETESTGLSPLSSIQSLIAERAMSASIDIGGPVEIDDSEIELNFTAFASRIKNPIQSVGTGMITSIGVEGMELLNGVGNTQTWGSEVLARITRHFGDDDESPAIRITGSYTYQRSTECEPIASTSLQLRNDSCVLQDVSMTPRHSAGIVTSIEKEGVSRVGIEMYYTGNQRLEHNPYLSEGKPYLLLGVMGQRAFDTKVGLFSVFLNFENITNVHQSKYHSLLLSERGAGGRWTTDAWTDLAGFTMNGGVRYTW